MTYKFKIIFKYLLKDNLEETWKEIVKYICTVYTGNLW